MNCEISRRTRATPSRSVTLTLACALALASGNTFGLGSDTVFISGNAGITYDNNVFKLSPDLTEQQVQQAIGTTDKGSAIYSLGAGISADVPYSRQRFQANLNVTNYRYSNFSFIDYVGGSGRAEWLWQYGDDWRGDMGATVSRTLQGYGYTATTQKNIIDTKTIFFDPRYRIAPNWELQGGVNYITVRNSLPSSEINNYNQAGLYAGTRYVTPSDNSVGLKIQTYNVRFPNVFFSNGSTQDNAYRQSQLAAFFDWRLSGASQIDGSLGPTWRNHQNLTQRDFVGTTGYIGWNWTPSARSFVRFVAARNVGGLEDVATTYVRAYVLSAAPTYQLTGKIALKGNIQYQNILFLGNAGFGTVDSNTGRNDQLYILGVGATYQATRTLQFALNYTISHRTSNVPFDGYDDQTVSLNGQLRF